MPSAVLAREGFADSRGSCGDECYCVVRSSFSTVAGSSLHVGGGLLNEDRRLLTRASRLGRESLCHRKQTAGREHVTPLAVCSFRILDS
jgi:hypothetical protein